MHLGLLSLLKQHKIKQTFCTPSSATIKSNDVQVATKMHDTDCYERKVYLLMSIEEDNAFRATNTP